MLVGVLSDTHGSVSAIEACLSKMRDVQLILHAGDYFEDAQKIAAKLGIKVVGVTGNCDYMVKGPSEEMVMAGGRRIYLTHGHQYQVKRDLFLLIKRARTLRADVAVFGHTHVPTVFQRDGILFINPGSPQSPRRGFPPGFVLLEIEPDVTRAKIVPLGRTLL